MADDVNDYGKNIAKGMMPFGGSEKMGKADPEPLLKALQQLLGMAPQESNKGRYDPNANEAARRAAIAEIMSQTGNQNSMPLPGQKAPQK